MKQNKKGQNRNGQSKKAQNRKAQNRKAQNRKVQNKIATKTIQASKKPVSTETLPYRLTNDYLFRAVFQTREKAREGLCRAILRLPKEASVKTEVRNPIQLGKKIESKEFILDLFVLVNHFIYINLEMQMYHDPAWRERSISYACRSFDSLNRGEGYKEALPVIHLGFLDYDLFPENPRFASDYLLTDTKTGQTYSDKLRISVVNLNHIELATEEDIAHGLDLWARAFNAKTWKEIQMLAEKNEYLQDAVTGMAVLTEDEMIRQQCQAREDFEYWERIRENMRQKELEERDKKLEEQDKKLVEKNKKLEEQNQMLEQQYRAISQLTQTISELNARLARLEAEKS